MLSIFSYLEIFLCLSQQYDEYLSRQSETVFVLLIYNIWNSLSLLSVLYCIVLYCIVVYCITFYYKVLYYLLLYFIDFFKRNPQTLFWWFFPFFRHSYIYNFSLSLYFMLNCSRHHHRQVMKKKLNPCYVEAKVGVRN